MNDTARNALVVVDPQNDFCDRKGSLYVEGADGDVERLARHIADSGKTYSDIFVSLDSHDAVAIFHPKFWTDGNSRRPLPFTQISPEDFSSGAWKVAAEENREAAAKTFEVLREKKLGSLMVWPEHCVVSTWGHRIADALLGALDTWRETSGRAVRYVFKGENPFTDQFSIFEGVDPSWPETAFNESLFERLRACDSVTFAGEALSHCVKDSLLSYLARPGTGAQEVRLLSDCTSPVSGFDGKAALEALVSAGVRLRSAAT